MEYKAIYDEALQFRNLINEMKDEKDKLIKEICNSPTEEEILDISERLKILTDIAKIIMNRQSELIKLRRDFRSGRTY